MKRIETSVVIQMPIDQVLAYLIEPANYPNGSLDTWPGRTSISMGRHSRSGSKRRVRRRLAVSIMRKTQGGNCPYQYQRSKKL
jgi:hypothetical protein